MSDQFSFASFFPESIQPAISSYSNFVFNLLKKCGFCKSAIINQTETGTGVGYSLTSNSLPGNDSA